MGCVNSNPVEKRTLLDDNSLRAKKRRSSQPITANLVHEEYVRDITDYYDIHRSAVLGSGTSGTVTVCTHRSTGTLYALKTLFKSRIKSTESMEKLRQECRILASLDHPNIIRLHEYFETDSNMYLVLELCRGGALLEHLNAQSAHRYGEFTACRYVHTMLSAVRYCHDHGIVHRDLKLDNFLLEDESPGAEIKLIDFGISSYFDREWGSGRGGVEKAKSFGGSAATPQTFRGPALGLFSPSDASQDSGTTASKVQYGPPVGTPYYVAPEVLEGYYDARCDVWSMGVIAYMLLTGEPPFNGSNEHSIFLAVRRGQVSFPDELFGSVSAEAQDFIQQCLTHSMEKRPTSATMMGHPWFQLVHKFDAVQPRPTIRIPDSFDASQNTTEFFNGSADMDDPPPSPPPPESAERQLIQRQPSGVSSDIIARLMLFEKKSMLSKLFMEVVAHALSSDEVRHLKHEFEKFDTDRTGEISYADFYSVLRGGGDASGAGTGVGAVSDEDLQHLAEGINLEHSGSIRYHEFIAATLESQCITDNNLRIAFEQLSNRNDYIVAEDLLDLLGKDGSMQAVSAMLRESGMSASHMQISFDQFRRIMRGESPLPSKGARKAASPSLMTSPYKLHKKKLLFSPPMGARDRKTTDAAKTKRPHRPLSGSKAAKVTPMACDEGQGVDHILAGIDSSLAECDEDETVSTRVGVGGDDAPREKYATAAEVQLDILVDRAAKAVN